MVRYRAGALLLDPIQMGVFEIVCNSQMEGRRSLDCKPAGQHGFGPSAATKRARVEKDMESVQRNESRSIETSGLGRDTRCQVGQRDRGVWSLEEKSDVSQTQRNVPVG